MPIYAVYNLGDGEEEPTFHCVEGLADLIDTLLDDWVAGDVDMPGVMTFLRARYVDEDKLEGVDDKIKEAADIVRDIVAEEGDTVAKEFLATIAEGFRVEEIAEVDLPEKVQDFLVRFLTSGAYGGAPKCLTEADAQLWLKVPSNQRMVQEALAGWKPAEVAVMDDEDLAELLLVGLVWSGLMETLRRA